MKTNINTILVLLTIAFIFVSNTTLANNNFTEIKCKNCKYPSIDSIIVYANNNEYLINNTDRLNTDKSIAKLDNNDILRIKIEKVIEFIIAIVGTFLGFILAFWLQVKNNKESKKSKIKKVLSSIVEELSDIKAGLVEDMKNPLEHKISIPAWETALSSGIILELIDYDNVYKKIILSYSMIKELNEAVQDRDNSGYILQLMDEIANVSDETILAVKVIIK